MIGIDEISIRKGHNYRVIVNDLERGCLIWVGGEYKRLSGRDRRYIKGQRYTLLSRRENLSLDGRRALKKLLQANRRLNTAYVLKG